MGNLHAPLERAFPPTSLRASQRAYFWTQRFFREDWESSRQSSGGSRLKFKAIQHNLPEITAEDLSTDQLYLKRMCEGISSDSCSECLANTQETCQMRDGGRLLTGCFAYTSRPTNHRKTSERWLNSS